jgi:glycine cleavage system aminomethyltransferase T
MSDRFTFDGDGVEFREGDSMAVALLRAGIHPTGGGCICLEGDCPNCLATVDGVSYVRTCQTRARHGAVAVSHPRVGPPALPEVGHGAPLSNIIRFADVVVIGQGISGQAAGEEARAASRTVIALEAREGTEAIGIYGGPTVVARTPSGMMVIHAQEVVVATGASQEQPICTGSHLAGIYTSRAAAILQESGVDLGRVVSIQRPERPVRFEGTDKVRAVVVATSEGEQSLEADSVVLDLGLHPRDTLARMGNGLNVTTVGDAAAIDQLAPVPRDGIVCPCSNVSVSDLESVWERGFREMELLKRATLAGTGTCQGSVCLPHLRAFVRGRGGSAPAPFTARPVARQATMREASSSYHLAPMRRTALHDVHLGMGAHMDRFGGWWRPWRYGEVTLEYRAVRNAVSIGDVGTLGKFVVGGPDATEFLERLYPCRVGDLRPGRSRYALMLDERGYVVEDGLICRDGPERYLLTFTSAGATFAEMWMRDWAESGDFDVRIMDRTTALGAINVTGPRSKALLERAGVSKPPGFMQHGMFEVAGFPCRIFRLSFTGEMSFELHHSVDCSVELWEALLSLGGDLDIYPHGLDALFALRLEKGHIIIGMDTEFDSTPRRLEMEWAVRMDKPAFIGREALRRVDALPLDKQLIGLEVDGPPPIEGAVLWDGGQLSGQVTSSRYSETLGKGVMLGWVKLQDGRLPDVVECEDRPLRRAPVPFYDPEGHRARA